MDTFTGSVASGTAFSIFLNNGIYITAFSILFIYFCISTLLLTCIDKVCISSWHNNVSFLYRNAAYWTGNLHMSALCYCVYLLHLSNNYCTKYYFPLYCFYSNLVPRYLTININVCQYECSPASSQAATHLVIVMQNN